MGSDSQFRLSNPSTTADSVNKECLTLKEDERLNGIINKAGKSFEEIPSSTNNVFLTHTQLSQKCTKLRKERNVLQIELLHRLNTVLILHKCFMLLFS